MATEETTVEVAVCGKPFAFPEHALSEGANNLMLFGGDSCGLAAYASGVAIVLSILANRGLITINDAS